MKKEKECIFFAMECLDCGWDWIGSYAICNHCNGYNTRIIEEDENEMFNRMYWMNIKKIKGFYDPEMSIRMVDRMFDM